MSEARLRIAYFVPPSQHFAGIERVVHEIATGLMQDHGDQLDVHVLFASHYDDEALVATRYQRHVLGVHRLRHLAGALRARVATEDYDVLVCPQIEASVIAWLATRGLRLPVFVTHLHGNPQIEEREGTRRTRVAFTLFRHIVSRRVSAVLAVSPSLRRFAENRVTRHAPVLYAKNPMRELGDAGGHSPAADGRFRFLNVGRLSRQKGQDILLRALALARPDLPPVCLTLLGTGSDEADLKRLSSSLGLDDVVEFAGYAADPADHFRRADCFVLASRWEGFGMVLVEALHFGLRLLATDCDFGPSDVITDVRIGDLVAAVDPQALAQGLRRAVAAETHRPEDEQLRRAVAARYSRAAATVMHYDALVQIVAAVPSRSGRLAAFVPA
jgi:glycosyltransferase involved in cell wall biosynthesis